MSQQQIEQWLQKALLQNGEMIHSLYKFELEEHLAYWYEGLVADNQQWLCCHGPTYAQQSGVHQ